MNQTTTTKQPSGLKKIEPIITQAIKDLVGVTDEQSIRQVTTRCMLEMEKVVTPGVYGKARTQFRKAIEKEFPDSPTLQPGYYFTKAGKGKDDRYEHLALWYATTGKERWDVVGDEARIEYFKNLSPLPNADKTEIEPIVNQVSVIETNPSVEEQPNLETERDFENMVEIEWNLETQETLQNISNAVEQSGLTFAEFVRQSCKVYAKTITGKVRNHTEDLTNIDTEKLRQDKAYSTHPGRSKELVRRAINAIKYENGKAAELNQKWLITQSLLADMTGSKAVAVKTAMQQYQTDIKDHNKNLIDAGATPLLNRKTNKEDFCTDWVKRFTSGLD